jgi:[acyl-carrier-protein] S-malonyltransferase
LTLAILFPGQGSQSVGMQSGLSDSCAEVRSTYAQASELLGYDLWDLVQNGPPERLNETTVTQPAMLAAGMAAWRCWRSAGGAQPAQLAGHSLGEYTALVAAGSLAFADAVLLVRRRAELMQEAVPAGSGAMAAILGLDDEVVCSVCERAAQGEVVSAVNFNSPGQVVIAGSAAAVERAAEGAKEAGARRALMLSVSVPSHCALMMPAAETLATEMADIEFAVPAVPVIRNIDATAYKDADDIRDGLTRQLYSPVRWADTVQHMIAGGASSLLECGPGKVLTGLAKRIDRSVPAICIDSPESMAKALS